MKKTTKAQDPIAVTDDMPDVLKKNIAKIKEPKQDGLQLSKRLQTYEVPIDLIDPHQDNPNQMDEETFNRLAEEMDAKNPMSPGFIEPIQVIPLENGRYKIVGGEHRWRIMRSRGEKTIPAMLMTDEKWKSDEFQQLMLVRLNAMRGSVNPAKFVKLYEAFKAKHGAEKLQHMFAVTDSDQWNRMIANVAQNVKKTNLPKEAVKEFVDQAKSAKTVADLSTILNGLFQKYGNDIKYNFMVFTFGKREHLFIRMSDKMAKNMEKVKAFCRNNSIDINEVMVPIVDRFESVVGAPSLYGVGKKDEEAAPDEDVPATA